MLLRIVKIESLYSQVQEIKSTRSSSFCGVEGEVFACDILMNSIRELVGNVGSFLFTYMLEVSWLRVQACYQRSSFG